MMPACTGPTATSWTSSPLTRKKGYASRSTVNGSRPGARWSGGWRRSGLSQGCPWGTTPHCSAISRSNRCAAGHIGVRDSDSHRRRWCWSRPASRWRSWARIATSRLSVGPSGMPKNEISRQPSPTAASTVVAEPVLSLARHGRPRHAPAVPEAERVEAVHGAPPPRLVAARASTSWRAAGMYSPSSRTPAASASGPPRSQPDSRSLRQRRIGLAVRYLEDDRGHADEDRSPGGRASRPPPTDARPAPRRSGW